MNQESYKFKLFPKTTPKPLHQLMCPFPVYMKLGAKNLDTKCQTEEVCRLFYVFQKERHGFDRWTSISLSIHSSLYLFIHHRSYARGWQIGRDDWTNKLWWEPSTAHHGAGKLSIPQFNMVRKWPLLGTCVVRDHWSWPGESSKRAITSDCYYGLYDGEALH